VTYAEGPSAIEAAVTCGSKTVTFKSR
jgi:hypothetical protein